VELLAPLELFVPLKALPELPPCDPELLERERLVDE